MAASPQFVATPNALGVLFVTSDGTNAQTIFTPGADGSRVSAIAVSTDNSTVIDVVLSVVQSSVSFYLARVRMPAASAGIPLVVVSLLDPDLIVWLDRQDPGIILPNGSVLQVECSAALDSGKTLWVTAFGGDF